MALAERFFKTFLSPYLLLNMPVVGNNDGLFLCPLTVGRFLAPRRARRIYRQSLLFRHIVVGLVRARVIGRPGLLRRSLFLVLSSAHILKSEKWSPRLVRSRKTSPAF